MAPMNVVWLKSFFFSTKGGFCQYQCLHFHIQNNYCSKLFLHQDPKNLRLIFLLWGYVAMCQGKSSRRLGKVTCAKPYQGICCWASGTQFAGTCGRVWHIFISKYNVFPLVFLLLPIEFSTLSLFWCMQYEQYLFPTEGFRTSKSVQHQ